MKADMLPQFKELVHNNRFFAGDYPLNSASITTPSMKFCVRHVLKMDNFQVRI